MALIFFLATMPRPSMKALPRRKGNSGFGWGGWFFGASMKALPRRKGNALAQGLITQTPRRLNESPSQKEGKYFCFHRHAHSVDASMKAPPKRKGNLRWLVRACSANLTLNESPSEKEGKCLVDSVSEMQTVTASMKVPPKRKGNNPGNFQDPAACAASMKVPPKRKGNLVPVQTERRLERRLNESPSEKEGKYEHGRDAATAHAASMKVPPKRKGNGSAKTGDAPRCWASMKVPPKRKGNLKASPRRRVSVSPQ